MKHDTTGFDAPRPKLRSMIAEQHADQSDRLPWPKDWFETTDSGQIAACRALWAAALTACIKTALGIDGEYTRRYGQNDARLRSTAWFRSRDFYTMCALAGLDGPACAERLSDPERRPEVMRMLMHKNIDKTRLGRM
ncbi:MULTISPECIES: hypothetical protein [unclassified Yoonia]|uniref:hypothetical protein n=1 Tax=unclassified Yoonia TaxID=2629118 RepID=UPI002AFE7162|nr:MULTISPECIES: hypothetical protein [unclassified Yoonia]